MAIQQDTTDIAETDQKATAQTVSPSDDIPPSTMTEDEQLSSASSQSHLMEKPRAMADLASSPRKIPGAGHHSPTRPKLDTPIRSADTSRLLTLDKMPHHRPIKQRDLTPTAPTQERQLTVETAVFPDQPMFQKQNISPPSGARSTHKKKRRPLTSSYQTPTDIFAQNLSEAILDADDSDEHEAFVYRDKSLAPMHSMLPPPWASTADHYPPLIMHDRRGPRSDDYPYSSKENDSPNNSDHRYHPRRPVLRSAVSELPSSGRVHPPPLSKRYKYSYPYYYMSPSDEENVPLLQHHRFHGRRRRKPSQKQKQTSKSRLLWILSSSIMSFLILWLILIVMANPLTDIEILNISNVLATEKELIFNLQIRARNSNWWAINISQGSLSIFASSHYVPTYCAVSSYSDPLAPLNPHGADPAEFLGTIYELEEPLVFTAAGLFNSVTSTRSCQIQLKAPGTINNDRSGNERWSLLIRYPYELTIRGVLRYRLSRWHPNNQLHSARVCKVSRIDPATGNVTDVTLPGQHICDDSVPFDDPSLVMA